MMSGQPGTGRHPGRELQELKADLPQTPPSFRKPRMPIRGDLGQAKLVEEEFEEGRTGFRSNCLR